MQSSEGGGVLIDFRAPRAYPTEAHLRDLAPGERRNIPAVANLSRHCANMTGPGIEPQAFRTDSLCA